MTEFFDVGKIVNTQGLKGEVRIISQTDFPEERYKKNQKLYLFKGEQPVTELVIASHRKHKNFDIVRFDGYDDINQVESFKNGVLKVSVNDLHALAPDEFYYHQIIGLPVVDESAQRLGTIKEILSPGANDVWVVETTTGEEILLPYIESVVQEVDLSAGIIRVVVPEGLLDDED